MLDRRALTRRQTDEICVLQRHFARGALDGFWIAGRVSLRALRRAIARLRSFPRPLTLSLSGLRALTLTLTLTRHWSAALGRREPGLLRGHRSLSLRERLRGILRGLLRRCILPALRLRLRRGELLCGLLHRLLCGRGRLPAARRRALGARRRTLCC